ncbi:flavodoxin family protein [Ruminiclostridium cellobioparum]|uniref:flavodoxin family protein n=1 Tax=Ruminiclostridium cellobioparum TaxID=29355 RepID=UPI0028AA3C52|nr:flavodoxin family protein [Ruminiclostridium cellobioparum]
MKVIAINGSPRKSWNTATILKNALDGAKAGGAETELINLYDYNYKGCISCFACKLKEGKSFGSCALEDDLKPILSKIEEADAVFLGSPIYYGSTTGMFRSFLERLMFQYMQYDKGYTSLRRKKVPAGLIYTMNVDEERLKLLYESHLKVAENALNRILGQCETLYVTDTYQFEDYSKYETSGMDQAAKAKRRQEVFPEDCKKAFEMGLKFTAGHQL